MVPKGWTECQIGDVLRRISEPVAVDPKGVYQEIGIRSHGKGVFDKQPVTGKTLGNKRVFWVEPNCFVVNIVFAWEQAVARTYEHDRGKIASHRFPMYAPRVGRIDVDFITYFFKTQRGKHLLGLASPGGAGRNKTLGQKEFDRLPLFLPPINEQKRIAQILLTWDHAIETVEKLIENSEQQKASLLQRMLRPGDGVGLSWEKHALTDIADVLISNVDKKSVVGEERIRLCNYTDVYHNDYITPDMNFMSATATKAQIEKFSLKKGDILITKDSETPEDIAVPAMVENDIQGVVCGYHLAIIRPKKVVDSIFLRSMFSLDSTQHYFFTRANGATRFGLTIDAIEKAEFKLPPLHQQKKAAAIIQCAENSVRSYKADLEKLRREKGSLMQQLLTGKRRIKIDEAREVASA